MIGKSFALIAGEFDKLVLGAVTFEEKGAGWQLLTAAYAAAGVTLLAEGGGGLHWLPFAFILAVAIAASNAWILLVEVLR